jgi:hypothetical protein
MFSVVNGVLLAPLPYGDAAALVWMFGAFRGSDSAAVSPPDFADYRSRNDVFARLAAMAIAPAGVTVTGSGAPARLQASHVSAELMTTRSASRRSVGAISYGATNARPRRRSGCSESRVPWSALH